MSLGLRHFSRRVKSRKGIQSPRTSFAATLLDTLMYPVALATPLALVPQALNLYTTHEVSGLSLLTWVVLGVLNVVWVVYGVVHHERPVVVTNVALSILNFSIAYAILLYH